MLAGRWAAPAADPTARRIFRLDGLLSSDPVLIDLLPGAVHLERVSADLSRSGRPPGWVRLAPYDIDQAALDTLASAVGEADAGTPTDRRPVVVECEDARQAGRFLSRLAAVRPPEPGAVVLHYIQPGKERGALTERAVPGGIGFDDARGRTGFGVLGRLTMGRPALYDSVLDVGRLLRPGELVGIVGQSGGVGDLTARLADRLLRDILPRTVTLLGFAALLGYGHRRFSSIEPVLDTCGDLPWWTELAGGWRRFEPSWRAGVLAVCNGDLGSQVPLIGRLVGELVDDGAADAALELCLDAGYPGIASDLLAGIGPDLVRAGRPLAVRRWLLRLPFLARRRHCALSGQVRAARRRLGRMTVPATMATGLVGEAGVTGPAASWPASGPASGTAVAAATAGRAAISGSTGRAAVSGSTGGAADGERPPRSGDRPGPAGAALTGAGTQAPAGSRPAAGSPSPASVSPLALRARLLGVLDISIGGCQVGRWHGRKGPLLLAYLLLHRREVPVSRDALAVTFWPDASPDASRNRLHVTLHTLRADLQTASPTPVVVFERGYTINPELDVRLDAEEFEYAAARGNRAEHDNAVGAALAAYRDAAREYRGDLLSDNPYEDWTLLPREHYRVRLLDVLGRAAQLAFDTGQYEESVAFGQRLLALDFCREDAHRLLMRAYARWGRPHLAVHQFELCARQLRRELDMTPARETVELHGRIRARSAV